MKWTLVGGAVGCIFGPVGAGIGAAVGSLLDEKNQQGLLQEVDDSLDLRMQTKPDEDGCCVFVQASRKKLLRNAVAILSVLNSDGTCFIKVKNIDSIPPFLLDDDRDFLFPQPFSSGSAIFYVPVGALEYAAGGEYKFTVTVVNQEGESQFQRIGREIFNGELPAPRQWYKSEYYRPLIGLLLVPARATGQLDALDVKKAREFIEAHLEVPKSERSILKRVMKSQLSETIDILTSSVAERYPHVSPNDIMEILVELSKTDGFVSPPKHRILKEIAQGLGVLDGLVSQLDELVKDHYSTLGLDYGATPEEIKRAYRAKVKEYHPDKVATLPQEFQDLAHKKSIQIREAYEYLLNRSSQTDHIGSKD